MTRFSPGEFYLSNIADAMKSNRAGMRAQLKAIESGNADDAAAVAVQTWTRTGEDLVDHLRTTGVFPHAESPTITTTTTTRTTTRRS